MTAEELRREQLNVRVPGMTLDQIELIQSTYGLTKTQLVVLAIDRLAQALDPENETWFGLHVKQDVAELLAQTSE